MKADVFGDKSAQFLYEGETTLGRHSVIVYEPKSGRFYGRNVIVTEKLKKVDFGKVLAKSQNGYESLRADDWKILDVESEMG